MKKRLSIILAVLMLALCAVPVFASSGKVAELRLEQYYSNMPDIDIWFYPVDSDGYGVEDFSVKPSDIEANLDGRSLNVLSVEPANESPMVYVVLLDVSTSIGAKFFENIKSTLSSWAGTLRDEDKLIMISMGENVGTLLDGTEDKAAAAAAIAELKQQDSSQPTKYYEAVNKAVDKAELVAKGTRCVVITITDGLNSASSVYSSAGTLDRLQSAKLPMYTIGVGRKDNEAARQELASFTKKTNGAYFDLPSKQKDDPANVDELFSRVTGTLDSCYVVKLQAPSNSTTGSTLRLKVDNDSGAANLTIKDFRIDDWQKDTVPPTVSSVKIDSPFSIKVGFSEQVLGADVKSNYVVNDENGVPLTIDSATYDSSNHTATLKLKDELYDGAYTLSCVNITDDSSERNPVKLDPDDIPTVSQSGNPRPVEPPAEEYNWFLAFGWIVLLGIAMLALLIVILVLVASRKKREAREAAQAAAETEYNGTPGTSVGGAKVNLSAVDGRNVELTVVERNGISRKVEMFIADSCIIGRSSGTCDLSIEDQRMSRQHFALSYNNGEILISDLGSSNGTTVNGIPVNGYRRLMVNDVIEAGNTRIIVSAC